MTTSFISNQKKYICASYTAGWPWRHATLASNYSLCNNVNETIIIQRRKRRKASIYNGAYIYIDGSRVGIVGGGVRGLNPPPQFMSTDTHFWVKSALNFDPWAKFQTFRQLPPVLLGQFQHWMAAYSRNFTLSLVTAGSFWIYSLYFTRVLH